VKLLLACTEALHAAETEAGNDTWCPVNAAVARLTRLLQSVAQYNLCYQRCAELDHDLVLQVQLDALTFGLSM